MKCALRGLAVTCDLTVLDLDAVKPSGEVTLGLFALVDHADQLKGVCGRGLVQNHSTIPSVGTGEPVNDANADPRFGAACTAWPRA